MRKSHIGAGLCCAALSLLTVHAHAQLGPGNPGLKLVNLDTDGIPANGTWAFRGDVRAFGDKEKTAYGTLELSRGIDNGLAVTLRGCVAGYLNFNGPVVIRHGGNDIELLFRYVAPESKGLMLGGGVSLPHTPAQHQLFGTGEAIYRVPTRMADVYVGAKGVFRDVTSLAALCGGVDARIGAGFDIVGDLTLPIVGTNTFNTTTGARERRAVYGAAVRFNPLGMNRGNFSLDLGVTNGLGGTTGFSLSPALGNTIGGYAAITVRY